MIFICLLFLNLYLKSNKYTYYKIQLKLKNFISINVSYIYIKFYVIRYKLN